MTTTRDPLAGVRLRAETTDDQPFVLALYATTREEELAKMPWNVTQKATFAAMQFRAQHAHYRQAYPRANFDMVERHGESIGRLYTDRNAASIRVIDITLAPAVRGAGLGAALLGQVIAEGRATGRAIAIHVERFNPALRLYQRLGFQEVEDLGIYLRLEVPAPVRAT